MNFRYKMSTIEFEIIYASRPTTKTNIMTQSMPRCKPTIQ